MAPCSAKIRAARLARNWNPAAAGTYALTAVATASDAATVTSTAASVTVTAPPPSTNSAMVNLLNLPYGTTFTFPATVPLSAETTVNTAPVHFAITNSTSGIRKFRLGYNAGEPSLNSTKYNVLYPGNDGLDITMKVLSGTVDWAKVQIRPQGSSVAPVNLGSYLGAAQSMGNGWLKFHIPITHFSPTINFTKLAYVEICTYNAPATFSLGPSEVKFTGSTQPFEWFGSIKNNNGHNGTVLTSNNMTAQLMPEVPQVTLHKISFYANDLLIAANSIAPYTFNWTTATVGSYLLKAVAQTTPSKSLANRIRCAFLSKLSPLTPMSLTVILTFGTIPTTFQITKAPLRFNKKFAYSFTMDDGLMDAFTAAYPVLNGGTSLLGQQLPGLFYTDGCGNPQPFKAGVAWNSVNSSGTDVHTGNNPTYLTWTQLDQLYNSGWDVLSHSYSHLSRGWNALGQPNPYLPTAVYANEVTANVSYTQSHTTNGIKLSHFVVPSGDDGYYTPAFNNGMKAVYDQHWSLPGTGSGLLVNNPLTYTNFTLNRNSMDDNLLSLNAQIDNTANQSLTTNRYWYNNFTHNIGVLPIGGGVQFANFLAHMNYVAATYGTAGNDAIWMAPLQEVQEYLRVRDAITYNTQWVGNQLHITFDMTEVPADLRRYALTLAVQSNQPFSNLQVVGATGYTFNGTSATNKLINLKWELPASVSKMNMQTAPTAVILPPKGYAYNHHSCQHAHEPTADPLDQLQAVTVTPNPAREVVQLKFELPEEDVVQVRCYDATGKTWLTAVVTPTDGTATLSVADLPAGTYFLDVRSSHHSYGVQQLIKL